ncbi:CRISPR system Cascade subunit CasB [Murinocardiopsis flavida]|uniref:CRISPR system Cascade subunit CasB n=1 Tax=Murinocardiopsis flavida TaxID=645275 RepID=A0A2P8CA93_9ACTN|nr:type I-E CRISPR-associated protein Cse2/CasB [Murinocardiopsis flavida]PSK81888.1 CRISPR system Cascade subunit CasB [Murinocardiopsis flavida]
MNAPPHTREAQREIRTGAEKLVAYVRGNLDIPAPRSEMRQALGMAPSDPRCWHAYRHTEPFLPGRRDDTVEWAFLAVAAMMASQPPTARSQDRGRGPGTDDSDTAQVPGEPASPFTGNLGVAVAHAVDYRAIADATAQGRLHQLCRQNASGLHRQLPRMIVQLRNHLIRVDWVQLACDLADWEYDHDRVVKNWLQGYHRTRARLIAKRKADRMTSTPTDTDEDA